MDFEQFLHRCNAVGATVSGIATEAGVSRGAVSKWKLGQTTPSPATMLKLEQVLAERETKKKETSAPAPVFTGDVVARMNGNVSAPEPQKMVVYAPDNSMVFDCIPKGAEITVIPTTDYDDGEIVAVIFKGNTLIRHFHQQGNNITLTTSNPKYAPVMTTVEELAQTGDGILGTCDKVTFHLR